MSTIKELQFAQPWTVPYALGVAAAARHGVPHILGSHCALHVAKTGGKLAAVFEALDHPAVKGDGLGRTYPTAEQLQIIKDMAADLMTEALRFANLYAFDLETEYARRVAAKNT